MMRTILAVVVGYVVIFILVFASFTAAYLGMGAEAAFEPGTYEVSTTWLVTSFVLGSAAAVVGGFVAAILAKGSKAPAFLAGLVLVLGILFAIPVLMDDPRPTTRGGDVSNVEAMQNARQPTWFALVTPIAGAVGVMLGGALAGRRSEN